MLLTSYDSPSLHTLYLDWPLRGALLMQTLARVNRTFRGKDSGLLVASVPVAEHKYPPDKRQDAVVLVMNQLEALVTHRAA
ncbi:hypothetical protein HLI28_09545 [Isoptericola sp. JC619]|uniref:Restriction endonuclease type I HsdR second RecA-like helicase domain-containing protein n=1 Tax=Isoptericola sediminis TaxID=2733572 RepID=A0A849JWU7_9MICO|nr:hypothetical protein [Isoptericola sediminis]NNU27782.1 hypothetical protein [Isoptericola sediminis]